MHSGRLSGRAEAWGPPDPWGPGTGAQFCRHPSPLPLEPPPPPENAFWGRGCTAPLGPHLAPAHLGEAAVSSARVHPAPPREPAPRTPRRLLPDN